MRLCGQPSRVHGAEPCPREYGHKGEHYWAIPFECWGGWKVVVYAGEAGERRRVCRGGFTDVPSGQDVHELLALVDGMRRRKEGR